MAKFILTDKVYGQMQEMQALFEKYPELLEDSFEWYQMSREEKFTMWWKRVHKIMEVKPDVFRTVDTQGWFKNYFAFPAAPMPLHLHCTMFNECISLLASPE